MLTFDHDEGNISKAIGYELDKDGQGKEFFEELIHSVIENNGTISHVVEAIYNNKDLPEAYVALANMVIEWAAMKAKGFMEDQEDSFESQTIQ